MHKKKIVLKSEEDIMKGWDPKYTEPLVSIMCLAYNHENYIEDALTSFLMQETDFPYEVLIHDDASTDKTAEIIRRYEKAYPNIIKPVYQKENQFSKNKVVISRIQYSRALGEYYAYCEGDDYWVDEYKLIKQVGYLTDHPKCGLVFTECAILNADCVIESDDVKVFDLSNCEGVKIFEALMEEKLVIRISSALIRRYYHEKIEEEFLRIQNLFVFGDTPYWILLANVCCFYQLKEVMVVYRKHFGSLCRPINYKSRFRFALSVQEMWIYFMRYFSLKIANSRYDLYNKTLFLYLLYDSDYKTTVAQYYLDYKWRILFYMIRCKYIKLLFIKIVEYKYYRN